MNVSAVHKNISNTTTAVLAAKGKNYTTIITATNVVNTTIGNLTGNTTGLTNSTALNSTKTSLNGSVSISAKVGGL